MAGSQKKKAKDHSGIKTLLPITHEITPVDELATTIAETITDELKRQLVRQMEIVGVLADRQPQSVHRKAIHELLTTIEKMATSMPKIESAVKFAVNSGWSMGGALAISSQNSKNVNKRHETSRRVKAELAACWETGRWSSKAECARSNYEMLLRKFDLWDDKKDIQKPDLLTLIRSLYD